MADNVTANAGSGGATFASDDISSVQYPRVKITLGADGVNDGDVASGNPMPVTVSGVATAANQSTANGLLTTIDADTSSISTNMATVAGAVSGSEVQVDVVGALPSGTNTIGSAKITDGSSTLSLVTVGLQKGIIASVAGQASSLSDDGGAHVDPSNGYVPVQSFGSYYNSGTSGWERIRGDSTNGLLVNLGSNNDVTVTGTVTANLSATDNAVLDAIDSNTDYGTVTGGGTESGALRVTLASDSTGVITVDDGAGSLTVDNAGTFAVQSSLDTSSRRDGTTSLTPKFANIDTATSGNNAIVAAVAGKTIRVISVFLAADGEVDVYFNDGTDNLLGGTRKIPLDNTGAAGAGGFVLNENSTGWFQTGAVNRPINLNLSGAVSVAGCLTYVEV